MRNNQELWTGVSGEDLVDDERFGFRTIRSDDVPRLEVDGVNEAIRSQVGDHPVYISLDIDVLDPAHAPGTGTPDIGWMNSPERLAILRGLAGLRVVSTDVVEVSPPCDHAKVTSLVAATLMFELVCLMADRKGNA